MSKSKREDLESLRNRFAKGALYEFHKNSPSLNIWDRHGTRKFAKKLKGGDVFVFLHLERAKSIENTFRLHLIRGEDIGYVILKRYELMSCVIYLDPELNT
jgi:hypothetical protein